MPTLDDLPIMPAIGLAALASGDLVAVYDVGDSASSKIKKVTVAEIGVVTANAILATGSYAFNGLAANQVVSGAANATMAITANTRLIVVASGTTSGVVLNPPTTATTRELFIMNGGSGLARSRRPPTVSLKSAASLPTEPLQLPQVQLRISCATEPTGIASSNPKPKGVGGISR